MTNKGYGKRITELSAYCALQARVLEIYHPNYKNDTRFEEISSLATKAMGFTFFKSRKLRMLEELSNGLGQKILNFEKQKPDIANSDEIIKLKELLKQRKR